MINKKFGSYFGWLLVVILVFTAIDSLVHALVEYLEIYYYPIPSSLEFVSSLPLFWYAVGKFVASVVIGIILYPAMKRIRAPWLAVLVFSLVITVLLEIRYILSGYYSEMWHLLNFAQHTLALYVVAYLVFVKARVLERRAKK